MSMDQKYLKCCVIGSVCRGRMSLRNVLSSLCERHTTVSSVMKVFVRHKPRKYREQHYQQAVPLKTLEEYRTTPLSVNTESPYVGEYTKEELKSARRYKFALPDFLPNPEPEYRDAVSELLEREDMVKRRMKLEIPEFYAGSVMAVTMSDPYAEGFESRFVGICIERREVGLRHQFTLRNFIDKQGIEIMYEMYNPTIKKIEVLKLEKRLDESLTYLRDAPPEYSTVSFDTEPKPHPKGAPVPINPIKVRMNPLPWRERWERYGLKGIEGIEENINARREKRNAHKQNTRPWEKHDMMKQYRESVTLEDQDEAYVHFTRELNRLEKIQEQRGKADKEQTTTDKTN